MSRVAFAVSANGFSAQPTATYPARSSFVQPASYGHPAKILEHRRSCRLRLAPNMRRHPSRGFSSRPTAVRSLETLRKNAISLWENANSAERLIICSGGAAAVVVASFAVNTLLHISMLLAFSVVPFLLLPILLTFVASLTAFAFLMFATAGAGFFFIGTPFFALALVAKALLPVMCIVGGTVFIISRLLGFQMNQSVESFEPFEEFDDFEQFDRTLRSRQRPKSEDVTRWSVRDVLDELDYTGLSGYSQLFLKERIDGSALLELTYDDIRTEFGEAMPLGDRLRLIRLVSLLRRQSSRLP